MRPANDLTFNLLELRLRLFHNELLVSGRLLQDLLARGDATKRAARSRGLDVGVEELSCRVQIMCSDSLDEGAFECELHRCNLTP
jgi:hypothetical protein